MMWLGTRGNQGKGPRAPWGFAPGSLLPAASVLGAEPASDKKLVPELSGAVPF